MFMPAGIRWRASGGGVATGSLPPRSRLSDFAMAPGCWPLIAMRIMSPGDGMFPPMPKPVIVCAESQ